MADEEPKRWWQSLPAILTGLAAVISALTTAIIQLGGGSGIAPIQTTGHVTGPNPPVVPASTGSAAPHAAPYTLPSPQLPVDPGSPGLDVMTRRLTAADLAGKSHWELDLLRNEIFARHGRRFRRGDLQAYFDAQPWYRGVYPPDAFPGALLTPVQQDNIELIRAYQGR